jgi:GNAT superfamily N-acetyltransferase
MPDEDLLTAFDQQMRRQPDDELDSMVEHDDFVVRVVSDGRGWNGVTWSGLSTSTADAAIDAQVRRFASVGRPWEWKHYSYDEPADLPQRLLARGFTPEPAESLLVARIADLPLDVRPPDGVRLEPVVDADGVRQLVHVHDEVFGGDHSAIGESLSARLGERPPTVIAVVAVAGDVPISGARVEFHHGTEFASLWGGGTLPHWRGRGVFRALVSWRAARAAAAGFRYLQVDATEDSRPILERLGFVKLAVTTPFIHNGSAEIA